MTVPNNHPEPAIEVGFVVRCVILAFALALAGVAFVHVKNQQYTLGVETRQIEQEVNDLRAVNQVLQTDINTLSSHAKLSELTHQGIIALVPISGQFVARLDPPGQSLESGELRTASAASAGDLTP